MRILIVEDNPQERELLRYLLEDRFKSEAKFREADNLRTALSYLASDTIDVVVLDLSLPDSAGRETFDQIHSSYPDVPIVVMSNNKDRALAIDMVKRGADDYVVKNYTDEEELFRRILFAVEKHRTSIRTTPKRADSIHALDRARAKMLNAHQSGQHQVALDGSVETSHAVAGLVRSLFEGMQDMNKSVHKLAQQSEQTSKTVETLDKELLRGYSGRPSMRSQVDVIDTRLTGVEGELDEVKNAVGVERKSAFEAQAAFVTTQMSNRTKILIAIIMLVGTLAGSGVTYILATQGKTTAAEGE
jgi:DNA-binding NarL/FixJ family response regulator/soluble cytochrome b562